MTALVFGREDLKKLTRNEICFLKQADLWIRKRAGVLHDGRRWVYNTYEVWACQLHCSEKTIERTIRSLKEKGIILVEKLSKIRSNRTNYCTIKYDSLKDLLNPVDKSVDNPMDKSVDNFTPYRQIDGMIPSNSRDLYYNNTNNITYNKKDFKKIENKKEQKEVADTMLSIWNLVLERKDHLDTDVYFADYMDAYSKFDYDIEKWEDYCYAIKSSPYLTGKKFNLKLLSMLNPSIIEKIKNGKLEVDWDKNIKKTIRLTSESKKIEDLQFSILNKVGETNYSRWFRGLTFSEDLDQIRITASNPVQEDYLVSNFRDVIWREGAYLDY